MWPIIHRNEMSINLRYILGIYRAVDGWFSEWLRGQAIEEMYCSPTFVGWSKAWLCHLRVGWVHSMSNDFKPLNTTYLICDLVLAWQRPCKSSWAMHAWQDVFTLHVNNSLKISIYDDDFSSPHLALGTGYKLPPRLGLVNTDYKHYAHEAKLSIAIRTWEEIFRKILNFLSGSESLLMVLDLPNDRRDLSRSLLQMLVYMQG